MLTRRLPFTVFVIVLSAIPVICGKKPLSNTIDSLIVEIRNMMRRKVKNDGQKLKCTQYTVLVLQHESECS